jgi:hypothetical protein
VEHPQLGHGDEGAGAVEVIELIELEEHSKRHGTEAPCARHYAFRVDKTRVVVDTPTITGAQILEKVGKTPEQISCTTISAGTSRFSSGLTRSSTSGSAESNDLPRCQGTLQRAAKAALVFARTSGFRQRTKTV